MNDLKPMTKETELKILRYASAILSEHGRVAGDRCCQDWSIDPSEIKPPEDGFSKEEKQDISFNYQQWNSGGSDYDPDFMFFHDEMSVSFMLSHAIDKIAENLDNKLKGK